MLPLLLLTLTTTVTVTYAWWNKLTETKNETINLGEGVAVKVNAVAVVPAGKKLVPSGKAILSDNQVDAVELKYEVKLNRAVSTALNLTVVASEVKIGGETTYADLVNISISAPATLLDQTPQEVVVTVRITEPANETEYDAIINKAITFTLTFTVAQV